MKAKDLIKLLQDNLNPNDEVRCLEETKDAITINIHGGSDSCTIVDQVDIPPKRKHLNGV